MALHFAGSRAKLGPVRADTLNPAGATLHRGPAVPREYPPHCLPGGSRDYGCDEKLRSISREDQGGDKPHPYPTRRSSADRIGPGRGLSPPWPPLEKEALLMQPHISYLVCGTPRSGSSLLCEALVTTGV